jgi:hypothetical protein
MFHFFITRSITTLSALLMLLFSVNSLSLCQTRSDTAIVGTWQGTLEAGGSKIHIVFHVARNDSGTLGATLDSPDQGAYGIPFKFVTVEGDSAHFVAASIRGTYDGIIEPNGSTVTGVWQQGGATINLTLERSAIPLPPPKMERPQEPKPPFPYKSEDVSFDSKTTGMKYSGTLTLPEPGGPFPAVVLITGSGAHDRNEEIFGHKPFLVIADYLTRRGIAVLRLDDRGMGGSSGNKMAVTSADHVKDVIAEIEYLKSRVEIDSDRIGLIGHSEGGLIAPVVATQSSDVSFVVLLAGTGMTGGEIVMMQNRLIMEADGAPADKINQEVEMMKEEFTIMKSSNDSAAIAKNLEEYFQSRPQWIEDIKKNGGDPQKVIETQAQSLLSPWFRYFIAYDPVPTLEKVKCPVLAIDGSLDLQVPPKENLQRIGDALKQGGNKDYTTRLMPGLNHLFQDAKTGSPREYAQIEETFSPVALKTMGDWVMDHTRK